MSKTLLACAVAVVCAAIITGLTPKPDPAAASALAESSKDQTPNVARETTAASRIVSRTTNCRQPWPYYELSCLHDSRRTDGKSRFVRVITLDRTTAKALAH